MTEISVKPPYRVFVQSDPHGSFQRAVSSGHLWRTGLSTVSLSEDGEVTLTSTGDVSRIAIRWVGGVSERSRIFTDAWERTYGESGWGGMQPERLRPWYWLAHDESTGETIGWGVRTQAAAWASWTADNEGFTLWLDVRSGQRALQLGDRALFLARIVGIHTANGHHVGLEELISAMAPKSTIASGPIVGSNNWYYAYGKDFDANAVVQDARTIVNLASGHPVKPFAVIDAGWSEGEGGAPGGPYKRGKSTFSDMEAVAQSIAAEGARPGLWCRPLLTRARTNDAHDVMLDGGWPLDPSRPETLERVSEDLQRFASWGFELIKHDFSTFDMTGAFGPAFGQRMGSGRITFRDRSRTTAEIIIAFYRCVAQAAGTSVVIGCNTVGHLAAGLVAVNRIGDDTSGRNWERTRRMGINALATRISQHGRFFSTDSDCVAATPMTPWAQNSQFLSLIAASGTPLFLSLDPAAVSPAIVRDVEQSLRVALDGGIDGGVAPLDGLFTTSPSRWRVGSDERQFEWLSEFGAEPFVDDF